jgi:hypothetical protein
MAHMHVFETIYAADKKTPAFQPGLLVNLVWGRRLLTLLRAQARADSKPVLKQASAYYSVLPSAQS